MLVLPPPASTCRLPGAVARLATFALHALAFAGDLDAGVGGQLEVLDLFLVAKPAFCRCPRTSRRAIIGGAITTRSTVAHEMTTTARAIPPMMPTMAPGRSVRLCTAPVWPLC